MRVDGKSWRTIWTGADGKSVEIIDQTQLPFELAVVQLRTLQDAERAIKKMLVRGAPLIGATAAYGFWLGIREGLADDARLAEVAKRLVACRPTAVNLRWAVDRVRNLLQSLAPAERGLAALEEAEAICDEDVATNAAIGQHGRALIADIWEKKGKTQAVNILTHCNAGWLATVDWGTALAPVYAAAKAGIPLHVFVDETRPRNQGASLTAWELAKAGIPHHLIVDNAGGHLMQHGEIDMCIVGSDRTTATGDVCNKIGTYLKALAARANEVPFYAALPGSTVDWRLADGLHKIPIEERDQEEVLYIQGRAADGRVLPVRLAPEQTPARNPAFDVTPAHLVTGIITERGVCPASRKGLARLFPEMAGP